MNTNCASFIPKIILIFLCQATNDGQKAMEGGMMPLGGSETTSELDSLDQYSTAFSNLRVWITILLLPRFKVTLVFTLTKMKDKLLR